MAKTATAPTFEFNPDDINLHTIIPSAKPGKYDGHILAMIDADAKLEQERPDDYAKGARSAVTVVFPGPHRETKKRANGDEYEAVVGEEAKYKRFFQDSAKAHDRTAKVESVKDQGDGQVLYEFTLKPKVTHRRHTEPTTSSDGDSGDVPEESAA